MKYIFFSLLICAVPFFVAAQQGSITGFSISPANPVDTDTIYIYTDLTFTNGGCPLDNQSHSVNGFNIQANTHHCVGMLTVICNTTDTFKIDPLPGGTYDFDLSLTSGSLPAPCTPGIVADDDSTFTFTVGSTAGIEDETNSTLTIYPNPVQNELHFSSVADGTAYQLTAITGQVVKRGLVTNNVIEDLEILPSGIYFLKLELPHTSVIRQIVKE